MVDGAESTDGKIGTEAGITPAFLPAGMNPAAHDRDGRLSEPIIRPGNNFWTHPPTGKRAELSRSEAPAVHGSDQNNGAAVPVSEPDVEAILVEDPGIADLLSNFLIVPVAETDLPEVEPQSEPEIASPFVVHSRPEHVPTRVDASQPETVDQHDDDVTIIVTVITVAALVWLTVRRSHVRRR
jgi:hypothetical protein